MSQNGQYGPKRSMAHEMTDLAVSTINSRTSTEQPQLKIGLLVDSEVASVYLYDLALWGQRQSHLVISHLILQKSQNDQPARIDSAFQRALRFLRKSLFGLIIEVERIRSWNSIGRDYFNKYNLKTIIQRSFLVEPLGLDSDLLYRYSDDDVQGVRSLGLNLIIACCCNAKSCQKLAGSARLGIVLFDQADIGVLGRDPQ